jgi:hypothetical protein
MAIHVVATIGPPGTCSEAVLLANATRSGQQVTLKLFDTYVLAGRAVRDGEAELLLVAAAFPELNTLVFDPQLRLEIVDCFVAETPELVLACDAAIHVPRTIACVAAPLPALLTTYPKAEIIAARSNVDAVNMVLGSLAQGALTTIIAAERAGLVPIHSFGAYPMAWVVMARRSSAELGCAVRSLPLAADTFALGRAKCPI